jgi:hypothetical protein
LTDKFVLFMKIGAHANEPIDDIVKRKKQEERSTGMCWWGYGGTLCHPTTQIAKLAAMAQGANQKVRCVFIGTPSSWAPKQVVRAQGFSVDGKAWSAMPPGVEVRSSRFALVLKEFEQKSSIYYLEEYVVASGPSEGRKVDGYLRGRVDKACAIRRQELSLSGASPIHSEYRALLTFPYAVWLREDAVGGAARS